MSGSEVKPMTRASTILSSIRRHTHRKDAPKEPQAQKDESAMNPEALWRDPTAIHVQNLKRKLEETESELRRLRFDREQTIRDVREEMTRDFHQKLSISRMKLQREKEKALQANTAQLKAHYDEKLEGIRKIKDKEIRTLETQLKKSNEKLYSSLSRSSLINLKGGQEPHLPNMKCYKAATSSLSRSMESQADSSRSSALATSSSLQRRRQTLADTIPSGDLGLPSSSVELSRQVGLLKEKLVTAVAKEKHKDAKLKEVEKKYKDISTTKTSAENRISSLLEELRAKERRISEFEQNLTAIEQRSAGEGKRPAVTVVSIDSRRHSILQPEHQLEIGKEEESAEMMNNFFGSSRQKSHGGIPMIAKEELDREKQRWQIKMADVECQLKKAEEANAEYLQIKAELNKKIVELEKNQKPLLDANKRLGDKNKHLYQESKKMEEKVRHAQEDFLILKDNYDRLLSDYSKVKEKRITPEKLDELDRFKQQNLEYCKCITALKQAAIEKDRKIELLNQKLRRIKKSRGYGNELDDDARSFISSECSVSSVSLDTITEDCEETLQIERVDLESNYRELSKEHLELQRAFSSLKGASSDYGEMKQKELELHTLLIHAHSKISELEKDLSHSKSSKNSPEKSAWGQEKLGLTSRVMSLETKIEELEQTKEDLTREVEDYKEQNELLEFRVLELEQAQEPEEKSASTWTTEESGIMDGSGGRGKGGMVQSVCDRSVSTSDEEGFYSMDLSDNSSDEGAVKELSPEELKIRFTLLKHRRGLNPEDKAVVRQVKEWLEDLQTHHSQCQNKEMEWELKFRETESSLLEEISRLRKSQETEVGLDKCNESRSTQTDQSVKHRDSLIHDPEKAKLTEELRESEKQCDKLRGIIRTNEEQESRMRQMEQKLRRQLSEIGESRRAEIEFMEKNSRQHAESLAKLREELERVRDSHDSLLEENEELKRGMEKPMDSSIQLEAEKMKLLKDTVAAANRTQESLQAKVADLDKRHREGKDRLKEYVSIVREYERTDGQMNERLAIANAKISVLSSENEELRKAGDNPSLLKEMEEQKRLLAKTESYNQQLESQFQIQLQMVHILKNQVVETQKSLSEKAQECTELEKKHSVEFLCLPVLKERLTGREKEEFFRSKITDLVLAKSKSDCSPTEGVVIDGLIDLFSHCGFVAKEFERLSAQAESAKAGEKEARERAEQLGRQHHDAVVQLGQLQKKHIRREQCVQTDPEEVQHSPSYSNHGSTNCSTTTSVQCVLTRILTQLKEAASSSELTGKSPLSPALLQNVEAEVSNVLQANGIHSTPASPSKRIFSPMEFSGTESEICAENNGADQSPMGLSHSDDRSSSSASEPAPMSPSIRPGMTGNSSLSSGADGDTSLSDSENESNSQWKSKVQQPRRSRGQRKNVSQSTTTITNIPESRRMGVSPTNLRLTSSLNDGAYFVLEWDCPSNLGMVAGYNVYLGQSVYKTISDPACGKVLLERTALGSLFHPNVVYTTRMMTVGVAAMLRPAGESILTSLRITCDLLRNLETFSNLQKSHLVVQLTREEACGPVGACLKDWSDV